MSTAFVLCVSLCAILYSVIFLIQRDLHRAASENLWSNPVFAASARFSQVSGVEGRAAPVKIDALAAERQKRAQMVMRLEVDR